jgi:hypothetical protein
MAICVVILDSFINAKKYGWFLNSFENPVLPFLKFYKAQLVLVTEVKFNLIPNKVIGLIHTAMSVQMYK